MSIETQVTWSTSRPQSTSDAVRAKGDQMAAQQTAPFWQGVNPDGTECTTHRFWIDEASANEWIIFVNGYGPISASIISS